ncbi:hypothetical protein [Mesorhizobium sp. M0296]|uniref:hypothetical protein n=1 Tax=Mesorhizobium sp. M0296 TaxID=2956931 RepID=UPI0033377AA8
MLANAREGRERGRKPDQFILDKAVRERLVAMTVDFSQLWADPDTKPRTQRLLRRGCHPRQAAGGSNHRGSRAIQGCKIQRLTTMRIPTIYRTAFRSKTGRDSVRIIGIRTTMSPKSSAQQIKTQPGSVELIDKLLDDDIYSEIAELLNQQGYRPGRGDAPRSPRHPLRGLASGQSRSPVTLDMTACGNVEC